MNKIFFLLLIFITISLSSPAATTSSSGTRPTFFEPYFGFLGTSFSEGITNISGTLNGQTINLSNSTVNGTTTGFEIGLKLYNKFFDQFILGTDWGFGISSGTLMLGLNSMGDYTYVTSSPSILIGWDIPTFLFPRIYATFSPFDSMSLGTKTSSSTDSYTGMSYKFGVSIDWWIQLGVEYGKHTFSKLNGSKLPYSGTFNGITLTQEKVIIDEVIVYLSYPFTI